MMSKLKIERTRISVIVVVSLVSLTLISFIFNFLQLAEAKRRVQRFIEMDEQLTSAAQELQKCRYENHSSC